MYNIPFYLKLYKIEKEIEKNNKQYSALVKKEKKEGASIETLDLLNAEFGENYFQLDSEKKSLITQHLVSEADKLLLPTPNRKEEKYWEDDRYSPKKILTNEGIAYLRSLIRKEQKEKREVFGFWAATITGIIGALTGLFAVLLYKL